MAASSMSASAGPTSRTSAGRAEPCPGVRSLGRGCPRAAHRRRRTTRPPPVPRRHRPARPTRTARRCASHLKHLRAFVEVADGLSFSRAAERLFISAPALSRQIRTLERVVGCPLFQRSTHRVELTLAGEALLDSAHQVLATLERGIAATRAVGGQLDARMRGLWEPVVEARGLGGISAQRMALEAMMAQFPPPPETSVIPVNAGGVPSLRLCPPDPTD